MVDLSSPIVKEFLIESFDNLNNINSELTQYESAPHDIELLNAIFRKVHTLKGSASFLGLKLLQDITHQGENILDHLRESKLTLNSDMVDALLESFDACISILRTIEENGNEGNENYESLIKKLEQLSDPSFSKEVKLDSPDEEIVLGEELPLLEKDSSLEFIKNLDSKAKQIPKESNSDEKDSLENELLNLLEMNESQEKSADGQPSEETIKSVDVKVPDRERSNKDVFEKYKNKAPKNEKRVTEATKSTGNLVDTVVRVNVSLLDKIMNVVGELVLNRNQILQFANQDSSSELNRLAHSLNTITTELQTDIMTTRMQPVGSVLTKFERVVRDLAKAQKKNIKLFIEGKDTELDKTLLEAIRDPLTHLIRNAVDHGIEKPKARLAANKSETAVINIRSYHEGGQVTIEIVDDGNGINPDVILKKAIEKKVVSGDGTNLSKKQIINLIFAPGFSTADEVTNISGRGVGMDVVKSNIEKIGGTVEVDSTVGEGTTFKLKIPLTLAIVPALVVHSSSETFAIPQVNLMELVRIEEEDDDKEIELIHDSEFFRLRGDLIPVFRLSECLAIQRQERKKKDLNIVVLKAEGFIYGLVVDHIHDTEEIVVKPLSRKLKDITVFGGATIMGDGTVSLIIDGLGFYNYMSGYQGRKSFNSNDTIREVNTGPAYNDEVLLCRLGDDRQYGIPLSIVHRLEEFVYKDVEWSGQQALIRYRDKAMPLINLEQTLKLSGDSLLSKKSDEKLVLPVVVVRARGTQVGIIVSEISDIAINTSEISVETVDRDGFLGSAYINEKSVTILDLYSILDMQDFIKKLSSEDKGKVLIVEDSELFLKVQEESFKDAGFKVLTAKNGKEGLEKYSNDLLAIVSDIEMPVMDGWDFVKNIRERDKNIPIIAISTLVTKRYEEILKSGFDLCFDKQNSAKAIQAVRELKS